MVLEHLIAEKWLQRHFSLSLLLGFGFTFVGVILARLLFGANSGIVAVFFVSLLLIPSLKKLFRFEDRTESKETRFTFRHLWRDNKHLILTYAGMFIGVYIATYLITLISYQSGLDPISIFREQLYLDPVISGRATFSTGMFWSILANNWWVLLATFFLALISGDGATFFVVWNASAWAAVFAFRTFAASSMLPAGLLEVALLMQLIVLPHVVLEGLAYILAGIAGAVISVDVIGDKLELRTFLLHFIGIVMVFWVTNLLLTRFLGDTGLLVLLRILVVIGLIWSLHSAFQGKHKEVFIYNYRLFLIALAIFVLGVIIETLVLSNSGLLQQYYQAARLI